MRALLMVAMFLAHPLLAEAADSCAYGSPTPYDTVLSREELNLVLANTPGADLVLREAAAAQKARAHSPTSRANEKHAATITPLQAERLLELGTIQAAQLYLSGAVYLVSRTHHVYLVKTKDRAYCGKSLMR